MRYNEIPGYCDYHDFYREIFEQLPEGANVAEVGVYLGHSVAFMATLAKEAKKHITIYAIDTFEGSPEHKRRGVKLSMQAVHENFVKCGVDEYVYCIEGESLLVASACRDKKYDFVFIDASHDYENVKADILAWKPKVKQGGVIGGHDYCRSWPGVIEAVDELIPDKKITKNVWWTRTM